MMENGKKKGIDRLISAFKYSIAGFGAAWKNEEAFRHEMIIAVIVIPLGLWLGTTGARKAMLIGTYLMIPVIELLNSAIEAITDRVGKEHHDLSGRAKDMGSAAVLLIIFITVIVWFFIVWDRFII